MALLGSIIARSLRIRQKFDLKTASPSVYQKNTLKKLMERAQYTQFGKYHRFSEILSQEIDFEATFRKTVPISSYVTMNAQWWHKLREGEENVTWPGKVKYFALSSGTSDSASKHIPVTNDMIKAIKKMGFKQLYSMVAFDVPPVAFEKGILMLGGTTALYEKGDYYEGDMSGISAKNMPKWVSTILYKPGQKISKTPKWEERIAEIVKRAPTWDVGTVCGVPAWVQIVFDEIIKYHKVNNIHDIWPNLSIYIHGGVAFPPYKESFNRLLGKPITFIETYMASEGSFGFQARPNAPGIKLVLNNGIYFEFVPFNEENFDQNGEVNPYAKTYNISEVEENVQYAVVLSTCAGAWRYLIGDVVKFTDVKEHEIVITGRTKQFLSICGEHLSIDNMTQAINNVAEEMDITIPEFTVEGFPHNGLFAHKWYIGTDNPNVVGQELLQKLDEQLIRLNDDYAVERTSALKEIFIELLPSQCFYDYMKSIGKDGAMNKFPRVMKGQALESWRTYLAQNVSKD